MFSRLDCQKYRNERCYKCSTPQNITKACFLFWVKVSVCKHVMEHNNHEINFLQTYLGCLYSTHTYKLLDEEIKVWYRIFSKRGLPWLIPLRKGFQLSPLESAEAPNDEYQCHEPEGEGHVLPAYTKTKTTLRDLNQHCRCDLYDIHFNRPEGALCPRRINSQWHCWRLLPQAFSLQLKIKNHNIKSKNHIIEKNARVHQKLMHTFQV